MPGIYIHIPFCRKLCYYCDFHFTVSLKQKTRVLKAIQAEINHRKDEYNGTPVSTVYLGGGTPTVLSADELSQLFGTLSEYFEFMPDAEITIEANPDDLNAEYLTKLRDATPVNRFSIGTQSFDDAGLRLMNRRHTAREAYSSILEARHAGFTNLTIDLIYGIPGMSMDTWKRNLEIFASLDIPHLSAYHLTFEPKTVFSHYQRKGKLFPIDEELSLAQFEFLTGFMAAGGYEHYEISNFARQGFRSRHNLGYWTGKPYLGFGPSAHSYNLTGRRWNVSNNTAYCESLENRRGDYFETETIDNVTAYHDYLLTSLRTMWGADMGRISREFGTEISDHFGKACERLMKRGMLEVKSNYIRIPDTSRFLTDHIISELMIDR